MMQQPAFYSDPGCASDINRAAANYLDLIDQFTEERLHLDIAERFDRDIIRKYLADMEEALNGVEAYDDESVRLTLKGQQDAAA